MNQHFTISRRMLRRLVLQHPDEPLVTVRGVFIFGEDAAAHLDGLPATREWISDCPTPLSDGACGCGTEGTR